MIHTWKVGPVEYAISENCLLYWRYSPSDTWRQHGLRGAAPERLLVELSRMIQQRNEPKSARQKRQDDVFNWVISTFGSKLAFNMHERGMRMLEEALELAQSVGVTRGDAELLVDRVFASNAGDLAQEAGAVGVTLWALCAAVSIDANDAEASEFARVGAKSRAQFQLRQQAKADAGLGLAPE